MCFCIINTVFVATMHALVSDSETVLSISLNSPLAFFSAVCWFGRTIDEIKNHALFDAIKNIVVTMFWVKWWWIMTTNQQIFFSFVIKNGKKVYDNYKVGFAKDAKCTLRNAHLRKSIFELKQCCWLIWISAESIEHPFG